MSQSEIKLEFKGLQTSVNDLSTAPNGSLEIADNIVIEEDNIAKPRRGFDDYVANFGTALDRSKGVWFFAGSNFVHYADKIAYSDGVGFTDYTGSYTEPAGFKLTVAESNKNLYFTTNAGCFKIDDVTLEPKPVGVPKAINLSAASDGVSGFLPPDYGVNYRAVWGYKDANQNQILGAPSPLVTHKNVAGASRNAKCRVYIPQGVTSEFFLQLYRSLSEDMSGAAVPSTTLYQSVEVNPSPTDITNGYVDVTDIRPDQLLGQPLYTNSEYGGIVVANDQPPLAKVIARFKDYLIYGNTVSKHRYFLRLLGTGSAAASLQGGDTIVIGAQTYTGGAVTNTATRVFAVFGGTGGAATTGSASEDIKRTAQELIACINQDASQSVYGFYLNDTASATQGEILIEERLIGGSAFGITVSRIGAWGPSELGVTPRYSKNDAFVNRIHYSKVQQPEAVTLLAYEDVGDSDKAILAMIPLRDSLIILKEDGCFRLSASLNIDPIDRTQQLIGPATAVSLNNAVFALTTQGVVIITDGGAKVIDLPISNNIRQLFGSALSTIKANAFAIAYETSRKYILFLPTIPSDSFCTQAFVYDIFTNTWVRWTLAKSCGILDPSTDKLILGSAVRNGLDIERKSFTYADQVDFFEYQELLGQTGTEITITASDFISAGDMIYQNETVFSFVKEVNPAEGKVTLLDDIEFDLGTVAIYKPIATKIKWLPCTAGAPQNLKHYSEITYYFKSLFPATATTTFSSDKSPGEKSVSLQGDSPSGGWGLFEWGEEPYGSVPSKKPTRCYIPREHQRCSQLNVTFEHSYAFSGWELNGVSLLFNGGPNRV